jgi:cysteinyl-tRNA synthetase
LIIPDEVKALFEEREKARKSKDFKKSDMLRDKIKSLGYEIEDSKSGSILKKAI